MSAKLKHSEKPAEGFRRLAKKELLEARECFAKELKADDQHKTIHQLRTHLKRLRALLRLIRDYVGPKLQRRQNRKLRAIARLLSPSRDCAVHLATLQKLYRNCPGRLSPEEFSTAEKEMSDRHARQCGKLTKPGTRLKEKLQTALESIENLPLRDLSRSDLRLGLKQSCRRWRKRYKRARHSPTNEHLHDWRKSSKDLACQLRTLRRVIPENTRKRIARLKKLGEILGDDHDLATVEITIRKLHPGLFGKFRTPIREWRAKLQKSAFKLGRKL